MTRREKYDTFISCNSADEVHARTVYDFLRSSGLNPFFAGLTLPCVSRTDFGTAIDEALAEACNFVLVSSSAKNIKAGYVRAEWRLFIDEKRAERKSGNILTVLFADIPITNLPLALRQYQVLKWTDQGKQDLLGFLGSRNKQWRKARHSRIATTRVSRQPAKDSSNRAVVIKVKGSQYKIEREPDVIYIEEPPKVPIVKYVKRRRKHDN